MTTIAFDGKTLAADTQVTSCNNIPCGSLVKIGRTRDGILWAHTGAAQHLEAFSAWVDGDRGEPMPDLKEPEGCLILISPDGGVREWWGDGWMEAAATHRAWGSGERIAMGAMMAGAGAGRAVEIAAALDSDTGGSIIALSLPAKLEAVA